MNRNYPYIFAFIILSCFGSNGQYFNTVEANRIKVDSDISFQIIDTTHVNGISPSRLRVGLDSTLYLWNGLLWNKVNRQIDTVALSNRINSKLNIIDTSYLHNQIVLKTNNTDTVRFAHLTDLVTTYNSSGLVNHALKVWQGIVSPNTGNGYSVDISSAGFTTVLNVQVQTAFNTSTASSMPLVAIKSYTTSAVVVNILQSNSTLVSLLGVNVVGLQFLQSTTGVTLHLTVIGY